MSNRATITVAADAELGRIDRRIYGHFLEHVGAMIQGGLLADEDAQVETYGPGIRSDVVAAMKELHIPILRYPGGCFADVYHWREGVGDDRPRSKNRMWGRLGKKWGPDEDNRFGTDEFLDCCDQVGALPYLVANAGTGSAEEAGAWAAYVNEKRGLAATQQPTLWGVGNEQFGFWEVGSCSPENYGKKFLAYRQAIKASDADAELVAVGVDPAFTFSRNWNRRVLAEAGDSVDYLAIHTYLPQDYKAWRPFWGLRPTIKSYYALVSAGRTIEDKIDGIVDECRRELGRVVPLAYDEWNFWFKFGQVVNPLTNLATALGVATILHAFQRRCDAVRVANFASLINVIAPPIMVNRDQLYRTANYHVLRLYAEHAGEQRVAVNVDGPTYNSHRLGGIRAVENEPLLDVAATRHADGRLAVFIIHKHVSQSQEVVVALDGSAGDVHTFTLRGDTPFGENTFGDETRVRVEEKTRQCDSGELVCTLPPHSLTVIICSCNRR